MAQITDNILGTSSLGSNLTRMLMCDDIDPGSDASYQLCKTLYLYHPLGAKMAETPIAMAQSQTRLITIPDSPESMVRDAFNAEWEAIGADRLIYNLATLSRVYGVATIIAVAADTVPTAAMPTDCFAGKALTFNVIDPLNTAGSFTATQDPNAADFQSDISVVVSGQGYHTSRFCVLMNEQPIYIAYTSSAFGYVGRSVYQRPLFALKSFVQSMITDDLVTRKAGLLVAKLKSPGSIINGIMSTVMGFKRQLLREAQTNDVLSIDIDEEIHAVDMTNIDASHNSARMHILENIAAGCGMPAILLNNETFAQGLAEGGEDAKSVARYVDGKRRELDPVYRFFDNIVQHRAWSKEFYARVQQQFPEEYGGLDYQNALTQWVDSFKAEWPSLLTEPDSEKIKVEEVKFKAAIGIFEAMAPNLDPDGLGDLLDWVATNVNENKLLFPNPLVLDIDRIAAFLTEKQEQAQEAATQPAPNAETEPQPPKNALRAA